MPDSPDTDSIIETVGVVAIGRNEGRRLDDCLRSLRDVTSLLVYVDSGSTDNSLEIARSHGAQMVELDTSRGFTAARARNAGFRRLAGIRPDLRYVQFIDGDCQVANGWLEAAVTAFHSNPRLAVVCGRRREKFPEHSIYNRLCDMEWNTPVGRAKACGGDALMRVEAFQQVGGYDDSIIAGEEPELCVRLRQAGWDVERINADMTWHDAAMTRFGHWWKRTVRAGHAYAEGAARHGRPPERHFVRETRSIWFWACCLPLLVATLWPLTGGTSGVLLLLYAVLLVRTARSRRRTSGDSWSDCALYAVACVLAKWPQWLGQLSYLKTRVLRRQAKLIEYKQPVRD